MANKKLFPNAKALPPKAPKIKGSRWKKGASETAKTPADDATTAAPEAATKPTRATKSVKPKKEGMSMIDAAKRVLSDKGEAMSCRDMIDAMSAKGYWKSPGGLTPHNTLYSAILRLIQRDGKSATFKKEDRGLFSLNPSATT